jgi:hypothetical protein
MNASAFQSDTTARRLRAAMASMASNGHGMMTVAELERLLLLATDGPPAQRTQDGASLDSMLVMRDLARRGTRETPGARPNATANLLIFDAVMELEGRRHRPSSVLQAAECVG